uniref:Uncharacterized protein n=1 Tax=Monopterus albus TaxID=43700 RepID=A0A3Q3IZ85_MONAL
MQAQAHTHTHTHTHTLTHLHIPHKSQKLFPSALEVEKDRVLLELSAVFDATDHCILLKNQKIYFLLTFISNHGINLHCYTDDTQLYVSKSQQCFSIYILKIEATVKSWLSLNFMFLNLKQKSMLQYLTVNLISVYSPPHGTGLSVHPENGL